MARSPFSAELLSASVRINGAGYDVEPIPPTEDETVAYRLARHDNEAVYDVVRTRGGVVECGCPDYEHRHRGNGFGLCKHGQALVRLGLVEAPLAPAGDGAPPR